MSRAEDLWQVTCPECDLALEQPAKTCTTNGGNTTVSWISLTFVCPHGHEFYATGEKPAPRVMKATWVNPKHKTSSLVFTNSIVVVTNGPILNLLLTNLPPAPPVEMPKVRTSRMMQEQPPGLGTLSCALVNVTNLNNATWTPGVDEQGNENIGLLTTNVNGTYSGPDILFSMDSLPDGTVMLIQTSTNLVDWTNYPSDGFTLSITSSNLTGGAPLLGGLEPARFFRARMLVQ